jgi:hypothetical protein
VRDGLVFADSNGMSVLKLSTGQRAWAAGPIVEYKPRPIVDDWLNNVMIAIAIGATLVLAVMFVIVGRWLVGSDRRPLDSRMP